MDKKVNNSKKIVWIALVFVLCLQFALNLYWGGQKTNYYIDEYYSLECAHYYSSLSEGNHYTYSIADEQTLEWKDASEYKECLVTNPEEGLIKLPPLLACKEFMTGRSYNGILNILYSFFPKEDPFWVALLLNSFIAALVTCNLFLIVKRLSGSALAALLGAFWWSVSCEAISLVVYIRFYMWVLFLISLVLLLHFHIWEEERLLPFLGMVILEAGILFFAMKNSELVAPFAGCLFAETVFYLLLTHRYKHCLLYVVMYIRGGLMVIQKTTSILNIFTGAGKEAAAATVIHDRIQKNTNMDAITKKITDKLIPFFSDYVFGHGVLLAVCIVALVLFIRYAWMKQGGIKGCKNWAPESWLVVLLFAGDLIEIVIFTVFFPWVLERYFSILVFLFCICVTAIVFKIARGQAWYFRFACIAVILGILSAIGMQCNAKFSYLYREDGEALAAIEPYRELDAVTLTDFDHRAFYECFVRMSGQSKLYYMQKDQQVADWSDFPDELLFWKDNELEITIPFSEKGYEMTYLGSTTESDIFLCERKNG